MKKQNPYLKTNTDKEQTKERLLYSKELEGRLRLDKKKSEIKKDFSGVNSLLCLVGTELIGTLYNLDFENKKIVILSSYNTVCKILQDKIGIFLDKGRVITEFQDLVFSYKLSQLEEVDFSFDVPLLYFKCNYFKYLERDEV